MDNGYDDSEPEYKRREKVMNDLSTVDKLKYLKYEKDYEIARQSGEEVPEDKHQYLLSKVFKGR